MTEKRCTDDLYDTTEVCRNMSWKASTSRTGNDFRFDEDLCYTNRPISGKTVDSRLLELLESLREVYTKRRELFKKIFLMSYEEFEEVFSKYLWKTKDAAATMQRSISFGDETMLERFKVKTPVFLVAPPNGQGGQVKNGS